MPKFVVIDAYINDPDKKRDFSVMKKGFADAGYDFEMHDLREPDEIVEAAKDADGIITVYTSIDKKILSRLPKLKVVLRAAIGYEIINLDDCSAYNVAAANVPDYCTEEVATHSIALMLAVERKIMLSYDMVRGGEWDINCGYPVHRLSTQTFGLIGFGRIARQTAAYAKVFGMQIIAYDPFCPQEVFDEAGVKKVELDELFAQADVISVNAPLTDETHHMINKDSIAKMKDGVFIVNTGRGGLISTPDLVAALKSGKVKAAGLDVLEEEPLRDANAEILKLDNVVVTSHIAYNSLEARVANFTRAVETCVDIMNGKLPFNVLNKDKIDMAALLKK
ncbi:MAG: C-terminal binding protein [Ruminococcaceae bacterium]|nr:C-terminal binding protein [Oscillospiraceae bacterium]